MFQDTRSRPIQHIRERTRREHQRTERAVEDRFFHPGAPDREGYMELLVALFGLYLPLEERIVPSVRRHLPAFPYLPRGKQLKRDLQILGLGPDEIGDLPTASEDTLPSLPSLPSLMGCLYVMEGSRLGHRVLWKRLRPALDEEAARASHFFGVDADRTRHRWDRFREIFDRRIPGGPALREAVATARTTFRAYREWLS